jgi:5-formyltetrahydrofolate cyclo-ligase
MKTEKAALRREIKRRLGALPPEAFHSGGRGAAALLKALPLWHQHQTVLVFLSTPTEIDTLPLIEAALAAGKHVFAPRVEPPKRIRFYRVPSTAGPWERGPFGIRQPVPGGGDSRALAPEDFPALVFCPGLAFTQEGGRLGYGGGFYDRFLAECAAAALACTPLGLCLECQLVPRIPAEAHDQPMAALLLPPPLPLIY